MFLSSPTVEVEVEKIRITGKNQEQANKPFKNKSFFHMGSISLTYI